MKVNDERREVIGGESAPTEDGDGEGDAGDLKRFLALHFFVVDLF